MKLICPKCERELPYIVTERESAKIIEQYKPQKLPSGNIAWSRNLVIDARDCENKVVTVFKCPFCGHEEPDKKNFVVL